MIVAALVALILVQQALWMWDRKCAESERSRLSRMAYAETPAERIAAALPETRSKVREQRSSDRPHKPIGI